METPKAKAKSRASASELPQKKSPSSTPRTARQLKISNSDSNSASSSPNTTRKTTKDRSPKVVERRSSYSPISEKKRPSISKVPELDSQIAQLQEDLKSAKDQLNSSESCRIKAQEEAEEVKKQLLTLSKELEESHQQILDLSTSDEARLQELRKISQDRDREWQSELEAVQKQHSMDSSALVSAMNEIKKLKSEVERVHDSKSSPSNNTDSAHDEIQDLRLELDEALFTIKKLKDEASDCKKSESRALEVVGKMQMQLETVNTTVETLRSDGMKAKEAYESLALELEQSRTRAKSLEELVSELQADLLSHADNKILGSTDEKRLSRENGENEKIKQLGAELTSVESEVRELRSALDDAELRYQQECIQSTMQIRSAYELLEHTISESGQRDALLCHKLVIAKTDMEMLKTSLREKEYELLSMLEENKGLISRIKENQSTEREYELATELKKLNADIAELKVKLLDRETELRDVTEENNMLKKEVELNKITDEAIASAEAARAAEHEALTKLNYVTEEANRSNKKVARVTEQLDAAQASNSELEAELRRLKVQSDQWRKAAEAAASMLSSGNNGKFVGKTGALDSSFNSISSKMMNSPYLEDTDEEFPKKKSTNVLKKIGVLWKKNHH